MKKLAIFLAMMMIPFTAFALDTISDSDLNDLTGQAGVSIFLNTIRIEKSQWVTGYGDESANPAQDTNWLLTRTNGSTQEISFLGSRTLDIDIVSRAEFTTAVSANGVPGVLPADQTRFGTLQMSALREGTAVNSDTVSDVAVIISLPNGIQIANFGEIKTIGMVQATNPSGLAFDGAAGQVQVLIKTYSGGGTTTITGAGGAASANNVHIGIMAHD